MDYWGDMVQSFRAEFVTLMGNSELCEFYRFNSHEPNFFTAVEEAKKYFDSLLNEKYKNRGTVYNITSVDLIEIEE